MFSTNGPRIAIYSQDGNGLGHLRRNIVIGQHLLAQMPNSKILLFADSPVAPFFQLPEGMDHIKLPSINKVSTGKWQSTHLHIRVGDLQRIRAELLCNALQNYQPDLVLVDHMPHGSQGELIPALSTLKRVLPKCNLVLGLRDILDAREVIRRVWKTEGAYDALREYYDCILIYGSREVFDTARVYRLSPPLKGIHYCGYVAKDGPVRASAAVRERFRASGKKLVFVSAGGGADGTFLIRNYLRALRFLGPRANFVTLIALGANSPLLLDEKLAAKAQMLSVELVPYVADSLSVIAAADLVVCMAGYNTLSEVLHLRKKALVIPRSGPSAEQRIRCTLLAKRGLIDVLYPEEVTTEMLAERLLSDLERDDYPAYDKSIDTTGARQAATCLIHLVNGNRKNGSGKMRYAVAAGVTV
jgi:predicted glycosyltransferase